VSAGLSIFHHILFISFSLTN